MSAVLERISAPEGSYLQTGTAVNDEACNAFVVNEDAVIAEIYYDSDTTFSTNLASSLGLASQTLVAGQVFFCRSDKKFTRIKLTSGSIVKH